MLKLFSRDHVHQIFMLKLAMASCNLRKSTFPSLNVCESLLGRQLLFPLQKPLVARRFSEKDLRV